MNKKIEVEKPNKRNIEKLLRELSGYNSAIDEAYPSKEALDEADNDVDTIEKNLMESPVLKAAMRKRDAIRRKYDKERKALQERLSKIRRVYYAKGMTTGVLLALESLVDEINNRV